jgi:hypothetical protein
VHLSCQEWRPFYSPGRGAREGALGALATTISGKEKEREGLAGGGSGVGARGKDLRRVRISSGVLEKRGRGGSSRGIIATFSHSSGQGRARGEKGEERGGQLGAVQGF